MVGSAVLYFVKVLDSSDAYVTHSETYAWFWTLAYTHGVVPASILVVLWTVAISACFYRIVVHPMRSNNGGCSVTIPDAPCKKPAADVVHEADFMNYSVLAAFVFNVCVTIAVNTLYIYSTQQALGSSIHFCIQLSLSIFRLVYTAVVFPFLSRSIRNAVANIRFRFILLTINNLMIPCVVTALTSDACFQVLQSYLCVYMYSVVFGLILMFVQMYYLHTHIQGLLIPAHSVSTPYSYRSCVAFTYSASMETYCSKYNSIEVDSASLVPPFIYNNQCGSVVVTSYIPVLLLGYSMQLVLPVIVMALLRCVPYTSMSPSVRAMFYGIIWPEYWLQGSGDVAPFDNNAIAINDPYVILETRTVFSNGVFNNWMLLLTFGLCSPVLAVAIVGCVLLKMSLWVLLIGRFTRCILHDADISDGGESSASTAAPLKEVEIPTIISGAEKNRVHDVVRYALTSLAEAHIPLFEVVDGSFWRLVWCSALFVALLSWDMATDEVGWLQSVWVPLVPICYGMVLRGAAYYMTRQDSSSGVKDASYLEEIEVSQREKCAGVSQSPLHVDSL
jgi:hypothetical protein